MHKKTVVLQKTDTSAHKRIRKVLICLGAITLTTGIILLGLTLLAHYPWMSLMTVILAQVIVSMPEILYTATTVRRSTLMSMLLSGLKQRNLIFILFHIYLMSFHNKECEVISITA